MNYVYMLICCDGSLYCGYTNCVDARVKKHAGGKGAKYTRQRLPVELVYTETFSTKSEALKREREIKKMTRVQKIKLITSSV